MKSVMKERKKERKNVDSKIMCHNRVIYERKGKV